jgi:hypothetical protein
MSGPRKRLIVGVKHMFLSRLNDPDYCIAQAEMARMHAALRHNHAFKASLLKIADGYLRIARSGKAAGTGLKPADTPGTANTFAR